MIDNALYDAFGQRQVSTMYEGINQYHVVMEVAPQFQQSPDALRNIYVRSTAGQEIPLSAFTHYESSMTSLAVAHQGQFPAITFSFNLAAERAAGRRGGRRSEGGKHDGDCRPRFIRVFKARPKLFRTRWPPSPI